PRPGRAGGHPGGSARRPPPAGRAPGSRRPPPGARNSGPPASPPSPAAPARRSEPAWRSRQESHRWRRRSRRAGAGDSDRRSRCGATGPAWPGCRRPARRRPQWPRGRAAPGPARPTSAGRSTPPRAGASSAPSGRPATGRRRAATRPTRGSRRGGPVNDRARRFAGRTASGKHYRRLREPSRRAADQRPPEVDQWHYRPMIPLASDTETRPGDAMRAAIAAAEVGDEQRGEDPTVNRLLERSAALLGKPAALFLPSGTMCNLVATKLHTQPGDVLLAEASSHVLRVEAGGAGMVAGLMTEPITGSTGAAPGAFTVDDLEQALGRIATLPSPYSPPARLLCIEQAHNLGGGTVWPYETLAAVAGRAREHGLAVHMDGARLMNAVLASGV